jgi:hypothetical protein
VPHNFLTDSQRLFLHQVEYGALPIFMLTKESSSHLIRTGANGVYSSRYDYWRDEIIRQYQAIETLAPTISQFITGHIQLAEGVYSTSYENGTQVVVNYNRVTYRNDKFTVPAKDYIIVEGK